MLDTCLNSFDLRSSTSKKWLDKACVSLDSLLIDHAHCEKKAAIVALNFIPFFTNEVKIVSSLAKIAREELRHFDRVLKWIEALGFEYKNLRPSVYASKLHNCVKKDNSDTVLLDRLVIASIIEARSCERFKALVPVINEDLSCFYNKLYLAEKRHATDYIDFAMLRFKKSEIDARLDFFLDYEAEIISTKEKVFAFHSGVPE